MVTEHNPAGSRKRLGDTLRYLRRDQGLTLEELGARVGIDRTQLGRIEHGKWRPDVGQVMTILDRLEVAPPVYDTVVRLARSAADKGWWKAFRGPAHERQRALAELESGTSQIREFGTPLIPGLLQTEDYSRVRFADFPAFSQPSLMEQALKARLTRQSVLFSDEHFRYEVVLDEAVLLRRSAPADIMRGQLGHLAEVVSSRPNTTVRVLPLKSPAHEHVSWTTAFSLLSYQDPDASDAVFVETLTRDPVSHDSADVTWYQNVYRQLHEASLPPEDSVKLIRAAAQDIDW